MTQRARDLLLALLAQLVASAHFASEADRLLVNLVLRELADECSAAPGDLRTVYDRTPDEPAPTPNAAPEAFAIIQP